MHKITRKGNVATTTKKNYGAAKGQIGKLQTEFKNSNCDTL